MAKQGKLLTAAEFQHWLAPAAALARLPANWTERQRCDAILHRMKNGSLLVVARSFVGIDAEGRKSQGFTILEPAMWSDPWRPRDRDFWTTGDIEFDNDPGIDIMYRVNLYDEPRHDGPTIVVYFSDVRLHPESFERAFEGQLVEEGEDESGEAGTPLAAAELERFVRAYLAAFGESATEMKALTAIRASYSDHSIGRDVFLAKFRELRGPGRVGKPSKTKP